MRRALLSVLAVLALLALTGLAAPAHAGGPTSVLLTVPGEGRSAALYYTDPAYDRLGEAVGVEGDVGAARPPGGVEAQTPITLTWLIHDVTPWRVDRVHVMDDGTTWVSTQESLGGGPLGEVEAVWHRGAPGLATIVEQVLPEGNGYEKDTVLDTRPEPAAPEPAPAATTPEKDTSPLLLTGAGLAGLLAGVLGTATAFAVRRRRAGAETAAPAGTEVPTGEQLAWP
jgi:hypothetical protein